MLVLLFCPPYLAVLAPAFDRKETSVNVRNLTLLVIPGWEVLLSLPLWPGSEVLLLGDIGEGEAQHDPAKCDCRSESQLCPGLHPNQHWPAD